MNTNQSILLHNLITVADSEAAKGRLASAEDMLAQALMLLRIEIKAAEKI